MKYSSLIITLVFIAILSSCKEVLPERVIVSSLVDTTYLSTTISPAQKKVVLIEEFTGASCPNCPDGASKLKDVLTTYPDQVIAIGVHPEGNSLAAPVKSGEPDLRTAASKDIASKFGINSMPMAVIDRKDFSGVKVVDRSKWKTNTATLISSTPKVNITTSTSLDNLTGNYLYEIKIEFLEEYANEVNYNVSLIENDIITSQKNGSQTIEFYEHKHVLRKMYTNSLGSFLKKPIGSTKYEKGRVYKKKFILDGIQPSWNKELIHIVGFITDKITDEVIQASEVKLK